MKTVLMVAFHFPPFRGSSGIQRTLRFAKYLPEHGFRPVILSADPAAYPGVSDDQLADIPPGTPVGRAWALDTARHLSVRGRFTELMAMPDRWVSWWLGAVPLGLRLVREHRPDILWSTFPIATAQMIGLTLHRLTGIPWVADFRDAMTEPHYPPEPRTRAVCRWIERGVVRRASRIIFTAPGALRMYAERYPEIPNDRWHVIENGYDEDSFTAAERKLGPARGDGKALLVHSGVLYTGGRNPVPFFDALRDLRGRGEVSPAALRVILRASGEEPTYRRLIDERGLADIVVLEPATDYVETLAEMMAADGLLLFQGSSCNDEIPAKAYEYFRAGRPIFALVDPAGDTASLLRRQGTGTIVRIDSREEIARGLTDFLGRIRHGEPSGPQGSGAEEHSRRARTAELARLFDSMLREEGGAGPGGHAK